MPSTGERTGPSPLPEDVGPTVARERLRERLHQLREEKGLTTSEVAAQMEWSVSKLTRIEKGDVKVHPLEVRALLSLYEVEDEDEVAALAGLSSISRARQWYSAHQLNGDYQRYVAYETEAAIINVWAMLAIPGLLQTEEYAYANTAKARRVKPTDDKVRARVELRMARQQAFRDRLLGDSPPRIVAVIDESVLRRPVGGYAVLGRQLDHLVELAKEPGVYLIVITPLDMVDHPGLSGTFELLQFDQGTHNDVLFVEAAGGTDDLRTDKETTAHFRVVMQEFLERGLSGDAAIDMIRSIRAGFAGRPGGS